jgi:hypothetical protein
MHLNEIVVFLLLIPDDWTDSSEEERDLLEEKMPICPTPAQYS